MVVSLSPPEKLNKKYYGKKLEEQVFEQKSQKKTLKKNNFKFQNFEQKCWGNYF